MAAQLTSNTILRPGAVAPQFSLHATPDQTVSLSDFRGRPVILAFYPADWSPVCGDQMALYNEVLAEFQQLNAQLLGISVDGAWSHLAFAQSRRLRFPLLADFSPSGQMARLYGVYRPDDGTSERALFVIDGTGVIRWSYLAPIAVNPGADGILRALQALDRETTTYDGERARLTSAVGAHDHAEGPKNAAVTLIEYGDYECPSCARAHTIVKELQEQLGSRLRFVFRNFPLTEIHPHAQHAAEAAEAAAAQGYFRAMHDVLFERQHALTDPHLAEYAAAIGLDRARFQQELSDHTHRAHVAEDFLSGVRSGVNGTPTFFINGLRHEDGWDLATLLRALEEASVAWSTPHTHDDLG